MVDQIIADAGPLLGKALTTVHTDSWESNASNWTALFPQEFKKRRGYDPRPWLPVMVGGRILGSVDQSERFLWDVRRTLADMIIDNHLKYFRELAHKRGLTFTSESAGNQQYLCDPIAFAITSDLPMGEFWNKQNVELRPDCKVAASAAHIANGSIAGAEAFTQNRLNAGEWLETPFSLKALGDSAFCSGINRLYFHRCVSQFNPVNKPGTTWPNIGINFDTTQTWWKPASAWIAYLSRCQYLLQQGKFVADVAIITQEGAPASAVRAFHNHSDVKSKGDASTIAGDILRHFNQMPFLPPAEYDFDFVSPGLVYDMQVKNGKIVLPNGMAYQILVLPNSERMTLRLARKIRELVLSGATIVGIKPEKSPTLVDFHDGDAELQTIARELFGDGNEGAARQVGKGHVYHGHSTQIALKDSNVLPDFEYAIEGKASWDIEYIHRETDTADIYFVSNQRQEAVDLNCWFRVSGRQPEFWLPDTGKVMHCHAFEQQNGRTKIPLRLDPCGSIFVVFSKAISKTLAGTKKTNFRNTHPVQTIEGSWTVHFDPKWGGPENYQMHKLHSWTTNSNAGIKYYSGTATYKKTIKIAPGSLKAGKALYLDLGSVKELARVKLNGKDLGVLWKPPYRMDIHSVAKAGENTLEIEITNLWPNRLIGDSGLSKEKQLTTVNWNPYKPDSPLLQSGLIGPVTLQA
jgi:hypothetical protein